jgi:hypothetical protein
MLDLAYSLVLDWWCGRRLFDPDLLDDEDPFEIDTHPHLFKHSYLGHSLPERPLTDTPMTPEEEHDFYAQPENQQPQGPPRRRKSRLSAMVPVRLSPELLDEVCQHAEADDRSVSSWIRRAVEHELQHSA